MTGSYPRSAEYFSWNSLNDSRGSAGQGARPKPCQEKLKYFGLSLIENLVIIDFFKSGSMYSGRISIRPCRTRQRTLDHVLSILFRL